MLVDAFPSAVFGTNCYVIAPGPGEECVVVDPGINVIDDLEERLARHRLKPVAVLLTHGHLDHTFSVTPVCGAKNVSAWIHPDDQFMLADPMAGLSPESTQMFGGRLTWTEPDDVELLADGAVMRMAGLEITVDHAPGHTPGSVMFRLPGGGMSVQGLDQVSQVCLSGDVLFQGSIGRTDLPGGSSETMMQSLREKVLTLADDVFVLPGHGDATTVGRERAANPFLEMARDGASDGGGPKPRRGL